MQRFREKQFLDTVCQLSLQRADGIREEGANPKQRSRECANEENAAAPKSPQRVDGIKKEGANPKQRNVNM